MRACAVVLVAAGCSSPRAAVSDPPVTPPPADAAVAAEPSELTSLITSAAALCKCETTACADPAYERMSAAVGERDIGAWTAQQRKTFHKERWRAEDCNLTILSGGDEEVLEHAKEALRDRVAGAAPGLIEAVYQKARELHGRGEQLPPSSSSPTPAAGSCCRWSDGLCRQDAEGWTKAPWSALGFAVEDTQAYSLKYELSGTSEVLVTALGDIDCDGDYGTFELRGDVARQPSGLIRLSQHLE